MAHGRHTPLLSLTMIAYRAFDYRTVTHRGRPLHRRLSRRLLVAVFRRLVRLEVAGMENLPGRGPFILVANHLHVLDPAIGLLLVPGDVVGVVKDKWRRPPFGWLLSSMGDVLYVGRSNRRFLDQAAGVLREGGVVAILPEGTRSPTRALARGHRGVALLAARTGAPILPAAAHGQEQAVRWWRRLRRVPVRARLGALIEPPEGRLGREGQQAYADHVMRAIAELLPPAYRGFYATRLERER